MPRSAGIYYEVSDGGVDEVDRPPLILIHGAGGNRLHWPIALRRLEGEQVYILDLPGHGNSSALPGERTIRGYVDRVIEWMSAVGCKGRAVWMGHSMGGAIAQLAALEDRDRVAGLVLVGTGGRLRVHPAILEAARDPGRFKEAVAVASEWHFGPAAPKSMITTIHARMLEGRPEVMYGDYLACDAFDVMERLGDIKAPTLVIGGRQDQLTPEKYSRYLSDRIPGARLALIEQAGHMVMMEQPEVVVEAIRSFLREAFGPSG
jgi:pimeloyl-ACP methyl ester carboxylesterase